MNLVLLDDDDFVSARQVRLDGRRFRHVREVLRGGVGERIAVGKIGGKLGWGTVTRMDEADLELTVELDREPPPSLAVTLVLALPRPPVLRRLLQATAAMGVKRLVLLHTARTEKSYWQSSVLEEETLTHNLRLGLEQARDTRLPDVQLRRRFRPFTEDELPSMLRDSLGLVAHPEAGLPCPRRPEVRVTLVVGPEGGFVPFEIDCLCAAGARPVTLGPRALRVETAVVALLSHLSP